MLIQCTVIMHAVKTIHHSMGNPNNIQLPHEMDHVWCRSTRSMTSARGTPSRAGSATPGSTRRLQMAKPNRSVLNTEAPPPLGRSEIYISETPRLTHLRE